MATRAENFAKQQDMLKSAGVDINKYNAAIAGGATMKDALAAGGWTGKKSTSSTTSTSNGLTTKSTTSSGTSSNTTASGGTSTSGTSTSGDIYGDKSKKATTSSPMDFSNYTGDKTLATKDMLFGNDAKAKEQTENGFLTRRNNTIAYDLQSKGTVGEDDIRNYLMGFDSFKNADQLDRDNTVNAIKTRLSEIQKSNGETEVKDTTKIEEGNGTWDKFSSTFKDYNGDGSEDKEGYYFENGEYYKAYGYDSWSKELQNEFDRLPDDKKKEVSNMAAKELQEYLKLGTDYKRTTEYLGDKHDIDTDLYENSKRQAEIQMGQTLRHAEEGVNNLMQNWQYLGNMGMPGVSATKLKAISDAIGEAKTTLGEIQELEGLKMDAMEMQRKEQELAYAKQIDDLTYNLTWQTSQEFVNWLGKFSAAELEGQLDTIDGITAFRREMLDNLDKNLSGITSASLDQMKYITQQYQDVADKLYEYQQNANTVNQEMSAVKGYYVDGNGNPIFNAKGETIEVPQGAPLDPVFDKETGKLITFGYDANGQIVASVQQLWESGETPQAQLQYGIVSALEQGYSIGDILKMFPNADLKTVQELSKIVDQKYGADGRSLTWEGGFYNAVDQDTLKSAYDDFTSKWATINENGKFVLNGKHQKGGQCGHFVNDYLQKLGMARLFTDPITDKMKNINSYEAKRGSIVIMDSPSSPQYGHVGIVTNVDENGNMTILQSNKNGEEEVFFSKKNIDDGDVLGFFDPTKSIDQYNAERKQQASASKGESEGLGGYREGYTGDYKNFLKNGTHGFSDGQRNELINIFGSWDNFTRNADAYKTEIDHQVGEVAMTMVDNMTDILAWLKKEDNSINDLRFPVPGTKAWTMRNKYNQVMKSSALQKLIDLKADGATFGALSDNELGFITDAADWFSLWGSEDDLTTGMKQKINKILEKSNMTLDQYASRRGVNYNGGDTDNGGDTTEQAGEDLTIYSRGTDW